MYLKRALGFETLGFFEYCEELFRHVEVFHVAKPQQDSLIDKVQYKDPTWEPARPKGLT